MGVAVFTGRTDIHKHMAGCQVQEGFNMEFFNSHDCKNILP
jgi:hypothetical protein